MSEYRDGLAEIMWNYDNSNETEKRGMFEKLVEILFLMKMKLNRKMRKGQASGQGLS